MAYFESSKLIARELAQENYSGIKPANGGVPKAGRDGTAVGKICIGQDRKNARLAALVAVRSKQREAASINTP